MKTKSILKLYFILTISSIFLLSSNLSLAQDRNIYEISDNPNQSDRADFYELAFNLKTTVYFKNNAVKSQYGEGDVVKVTLEDSNSFNILIQNQAQYSKAEIITVNVNDISELSKRIDLTALTQMTQLKYVFIKCMFKSQTQDIKDFIKVNTGIRVFFNAQNPS